MTDQRDSERAPRSLGGHPPQRPLAPRATHPARQTPLDDPAWPRRQPTEAHPGAPSQPHPQSSAPPYNAEPTVKSTARPSTAAVPRPTPPTPPGAPPTRWPFWAGFVVSFLFLTVASLGLLILSTGGDRFDLAAFQGGEAAWTPPPIAAQPTPDPDLIGTVNALGAATNAYGAMLRNVTNTNVRIRQTPGTLGKSGDDIIGAIPSGERVEVIGGPTTVDGLTWWQVRYTSGGGNVTEGWAAEVTPSGLRILGPDQ